MAGPTRVVSLLLLLTYATSFAGCYTWSQPTATMDLDSTVQRHENVRLVLSNGQNVVIHHPVLGGDSIRQRARPGSANEFALKARAFARSDVSAFQIERFSAGKTVLVLLGVALVVPVSAIVYLATCNCVD